MASFNTLFDIGDIILLPVNGGRWHELISDKRPTYIKGKTYFAKAQIVRIECSEDIYNNITHVFNYVTYLDEEEDCYFQHMLTDRELQRDNVQKVENYGIV